MTYRMHIQILAASPQLTKPRTHSPTHEPTSTHTQTKKIRTHAHRPAQRDTQRQIQTLTHAPTLSDTCTHNAQKDTLGRDSGCCRHRDSPPRRLQVGRQRPVGEKRWCFSPFCMCKWYWCSCDCGLYPPIVRLRLAVWCVIFMRLAYYQCLFRR